MKAISKNSTNATQFTTKVLTSSHLDQGVFTQKRTGERRRCAQKSGICHFFDRLSNGQNQSSVHERHDDVGIKFIWGQENRQKRQKLVEWHLERLGMFCFKLWSWTLLTAGKRPAVAHTGSAMGETEGCLAPASIAARFWIIFLYFVRSNTAGQAAWVLFDCCLR